MRSLWGKLAYVAPIKTMTIPRLELTSVRISVRVGKMIAKEWTNLLRARLIKQTVQLRNDKKRFHVFVANRVQTITDATNPDQ